MSGSSGSPKPTALWPLITLVAAALLLASCGEDTTTGTPPTATTSPSSSSSAASTGTAAPTTTSPATGAASPDDAIRAWMEQRGFSYAGNCSTISPVTHVGEKCADLEADRGERKVYLIGRTFSEGDTWLLVEQSNGYWQVVDTAKLTLTGSQQPPW